MQLVFFIAVLFGAIFFFAVRRTAVPAIWQAAASPSVGTVAQAAVLCCCVLPLLLAVMFALLRWLGASPDTVPSLMFNAASLGVLVGINGTALAGILFPRD